MAFGGSTIWEVEPGSGSDTANGGGFDPGATMATDLAATSATGSSPVVTSASYTFVAGDVGARLFVKSGTNWTPGWYTIASVSAGAATLAASIGSAVLYANTQPASLNTVAGCATTASPTGGTWSVDYSVLASPIYSYTDMVIDGTTNTKFTSAAHPVGPNIVGNTIAVTSGTGFTVQWVLVSSVTGTTATCDKSLGTLSSTGGNGGLGGALATIGKAGALHVANNVIFLLGGTTSTSTNTSNVAGGKLTTSGGSTGNSTILCGYLTHRTLVNTDGSRPVIQPLTATNNVTCVVTNGRSTVKNINFANANGCTGCVGVDTGANGGINIENVKVDSLKTGIRIAAGSGYFNAMNTEIILPNEASSQGFDTPGEGCIRGCYIHGGSGNGSIGIGGSTYVSIADTVIANMTGTTSTGIATNNGTKIDNVVIYGITGVGVDLSSTQGVFLRNVYCEACSTYGIKFAAAGDTQRANNCAGYNNGSDYDSANITPMNLLGFIACSASALTAPGSSDFTLNTTAGGGLLLRGLGWPGTIAGLSQTNYVDVGAYQRGDPAPTGSLLVHPGMSGGMRG